MPTLKTQCPKCNTRIRLNAVGADGREIECPKCGHSLTLKLSNRDKNNRQPDDEAGEKSSPARQQRNQKQEEVKSRLPLVIGAVAVGLLVVGGIVALAMTRGDSDKQARNETTEQKHTSQTSTQTPEPVVLRPIADKPSQPVQPNVSITPSPDTVVVKPTPEPATPSPGTVVTEPTKPITLPSGSIPIGALSPQDKVALARQAQAILKASCYRCHGQEGTAEGGFNHVLDRPRLLASHKIVPGDPAQSALFKRMKKNEMPPEDEKPRPTEAEIAVIRRWIEAGAPDFNTSTPTRKEITLSGVMEAIRTDLDNAGERDRPYFRYFTICHLYNAGWSEDELSGYRIAISKLVNSLSWGKRVVKPVPVDAAGTILRIDLRDVKWSAKTWNRILDAYPYGIDVNSPATKYCKECTQCLLPNIRGDWFVATASRPPLYHDVLEIPRTDRELEKLLHIDVEENIRQERVYRAGFNGSGVSRNNRLIERHETTYGAYWKSYDFGGSSGRQNLFERPLGPGGNLSFSHDGGEIIFSLPNGLQGYMLVDGTGHRIDKGPTTIVSDPKQADRAVVNGLSCMSCHYSGMIDKQDQVREIVMKNPKAFQKKDADAILALYPPKTDMDKFFREDAERFAKAVAETGGRVSLDGRVVGSDPVVNLALVFERELDFALAAAEVGVRVEVLLKAMDQSPVLARALGVLKVEGGTMSRQAFVVIFGDLVKELKIGAFIPGSKSKVRTSLAPVEPLTPGEKLFSSSAVSYLADLQEFDVKKGEWPFTKDGTTGNKNQPIKVNRNPAPKGLGMHPPAAPNFASVKYRLDKQSALFKTTVAIDDTATFCWTPAIFTVWGDGKKLFESKYIAHNHSRTQECSLDVSEVDVLELRVHTVGLNSGVHAVWVEPRLLQRADTEDIPWPSGKKK
ncbi:MAG TPA: NPCBM/NEW2 domain-containing protein [Gemmata sp.]|jgi:predicted Zn finger-like uncharacterized protein|nr:NPCBM/NEW2 domain-containing protein [Gemmata sp.]